MRHAAGNSRPAVQAAAGPPSWRSMVAALRVPAFAWYWSGQLVSVIGTWSQVVAVSWLVLDLTHSAVALGTITLLQTLPMLVFALPGGVIADRVPRRQLLIVTQVALAAQAIALGLLVVLHLVTIWEIGLLSVVLGTANALNGPAQQAFVPELVGRELVPDAVALNSVQFNTARMIGGAVGGLAVAAWGVSGALFFNAATFLPILVVLMVIRSAHAVTRPAVHASMLADLRAGLSYALRTAPVRRVVLVLGVVGLLGYNWQVAVPLIARFMLHRQVTGYGLLMSALGAGSLVAAIMLTRDQRASEHRLMTGAVALGAVLMALGLSYSYVASLVLLAVGGLAGLVATITANTRLQMLTPDELRGRVMGIYVLLMGGTTPVGAFAFGEIAGHLSTGDALIAFGATTVVTVGAIWLRRHEISLRPRAPSPADADADA
ncbi:MAG: MFS transporter [Streptosporangiaceae bacterium]